MLYSNTQLLIIALDILNIHKTNKSINLILFNVLYQYMYTKVMLNYKLRYQYNRWIGIDNK